MSKKYSEKLEKHLWRSLFFGEIQQSWFTRNLTKVLFAAFKNKKALTTIMKEILGFKQLGLNYLNNQKKERKQRLRLVISSIRVDAVSSVLERLTVVFFKSLKHLSHFILVSPYRRFK